MYYAKQTVFEDDLMHANGVQKANHKYVGRIADKNGKWRYFYTAEEMKAAMNGAKKRVNNAKDAITKQANKLVKDTKNYVDKNVTGTSYKRNADLAKKQFGVLRKQSNVTDKDIREYDKRYEQASSSRRDKAKIVNKMADRAVLSSDKWLGKNGELAKSSIRSADDLVKVATRDREHDRAWKEYRHYDEHVYKPAERKVDSMADAGDKAQRYKYYKSLYDDTLAGKTKKASEAIKNGAKRMARDALSKARKAYEDVSGIGDVKRSQAKANAQNNTRARIEAKRKTERQYARNHARYGSANWHL